MIEIDIANDFSKTPGGRYINEGPNSGELFRKQILLPKYKQAVEGNTELVVNFDGCYGLPTSFLEESFGGLVRELKDKSAIGRIKFISKDEPGLVELAIKYMKKTEIKD